MATCHTLLFIHTHNRKDFFSLETLTLTLPIKLETLTKAIQTEYITEFQTTKLCLTQKVMVTKIMVIKDHVPLPKRRMEQNFENCQGHLTKLGVKMMKI